jgi:hypothetical protein
MAHNVTQVNRYLGVKIISIVTLTLGHQIHIIAQNFIALILQLTIIKYIQSIEIFYKNGMDIEFNSN